MTNNFERPLVIDAAERYKVKLPDYVTEARILLDAATAYKAQVAGLEEPRLEDVTATTIDEVVDRVLAFGQRDERLRVACRVEAIATNALDFAVMRLATVLMTALAAPFDAAAATFMDAHDLYKKHDPGVTATLGDLIKVRDLIAAGQVGEGLPAINLDIPTRTATFACRHDIVNRVRLRTSGLERGTEAWLSALLSIPGCRLKWQTPAMQAEHVNSIPAELDRLSTVGSTRGDAA